jgi:hypothetical protein
MLSPDFACALIYHAAKLYLTRVDDMWEYGENPWLGYNENGRQANADDLIRDSRIHDTRIRADKEWENEHRSLREELYQQANVSKTAWPPDPKIAEIGQILQVQKQKDLRNIEALDESRRFALIIAVAVSSAKISQWSKGSVELNETRLAFNKVVFAKIYPGLPAFMTWLTDYGCTQIQYSFEQG